MLPSFAMVCSRRSYAGSCPCPREPGQSLQPPEEMLAEAKCVCRSFDSCQHGEHRSMDREPWDLPICGPQPSATSHPPADCRQGDQQWEPASGSLASEHLSEKPTGHSFASPLLFTSFTSLTEAADPEVYSQLITAFATRRLMREAVSWMNAAMAMDLELDAAALAAVDLHQSKKDVGPREELDEEGRKRWWRTVSRMREGGLLEGTVGRDALLYLQTACQSRLKVQATMFEDAIRGFRDDPDSAAECLQCASKLRLEQEASTFQSVIMNCCMHGLLDKASALVDTMAESGWQPAPDIYRALCHGQALRHNETGVEFWLSKLEDSEMELAPFRLMSYHRAAKGQAASSEAWLERAHEAALHPDVACYNEVLAAFSRPNKGCATEWALPAKRADGAWRCFQQMRHKAVEPDAGSHRSVLRGFARSGLTRRSVEWMQQMLDANVAVDETCYNSLLCGLARAREAALASTWLQRMVVDRLEADEVAFNAVVSSHLDIGDWKKAAQWLKRMVIRNLTPVRTHYNEVIDYCVQEGELDKAYSWLTLMKATPPSLPDLVSYHHLVSGAAALGKEKQAADWFGEMRCARLTPDPVMFTDVIHGFARSTAYEAATAWLRRMAKEAVHPTVACYNALISACARQRDLQRAEHWFEQLPIQRLQPDEISYKALIRGCCLLDETQKATRWLQKLQSSRCRPDMPFYMGMINARDARGRSSPPE
ncbi:EMB2745, partial [Symbiodinium microadriaticum]